MHQAGYKSPQEEIRKLKKKIRQLQTRIVELDNTTVPITDYQLLENNFKKLRIETERYKEQLDDLLDFKEKDLNDNKENFRESEKKFREIVENLPITYAEINTTGQLTYLNLAGHELSGYNKEELDRGLTIEDLIVEKEKVLENFKEALKGNRKSLLHYTLKRKNGELRHVMIISLPSLVHNQLIGIRSIVMDHTADVKATEELKRSEEKFRQIAHMLPETVFEMDLEGNFLFLNDSSYKVFGYEKGEKNLNAFQMFNPSEIPRIKQNMKRLLEQGFSTGREYIARKKDGTLFPVLHFSSVVKENEKPVGIRGIIIDISEKKQLEEQLNQSLKMQAIGTLAGGIAHDFNNILMGMQLYTELAMNKLSPDSEAREKLEKVIESQNRAKELTNRILNVSKNQEDELKEIDIHQIVNEAMKLINPIIPARVEIDLKINHSGFIRANSIQIHQLMINLVTNAVHAMQEGGRLTIELRNESPDKKFSTPRDSSQNSSWALLRVSDTGTGMDEITKSRIFDPFFTTKKINEGTGLGLTNVQNIVNNCMGKIFVESSPGKGTIFSLYLPTVKSNEDEEYSNH